MQVEKYPTKALKATSPPELSDFIKFDFFSDNENEDEEELKKAPISIKHQSQKTIENVQEKDEKKIRISSSFQSDTKMASKISSNGIGVAKEPNSKNNNAVSTSKWDSQNDNHQQFPRVYQSVDPLTPLPIPPWTPVNRVYSRNFLSFLDEEILDYAEFVSPTKGEHMMRSFTLERLRNQVCKLWPTAKLACFGSFETQLYLPSSDLDCCIIEASVFIPACLYKLRDQLNKANIAIKLDVIPSTKVPILKYVDSLTKFNVDISFNSTNGIETAKIVRGFVENPKLGDITRILLLLIKQFLVQRYLNEVYTGGLSSYALLCMIVSFLRLHPKIQTGEIDPLKNVGLLLIEFFELYGKWFNNDSLSIHLMDPEGARYSYRRQEGRPTPLSVIDPQDPSNNISGGSFNYTQVKGSFMRAFTMLTSMLGSGFERKFPSTKIQSGQREMTTLLGSILTVSKGVLDQREYIERVYEAFLEKHVGLTTHSLDDSSISEEEGRVVGKRKRNQFRDDSSNLDSDPLEKQEVLYVAGASSDDEASEYHVEDESGGNSTEDEEQSGDITAFYAMNTGKPSKHELEYLSKKKHHSSKFEPLRKRRK